MLVRFALLGFLLFGASAQASVLVVDASGGGAFTSLQAAVDAAASGDLLLVKGGVYSGFTADGKALTIVEDSGHAASVLGQGAFLGDGFPVLTVNNAARGPLLVGSPLFSFFLGLLDGSGQFHLNVPVPASQPAVSGRLVEQVVTYSATSGPRVSPLRIGVVLDPQF